MAHNQQSSTNPFLVPRTPSTPRVEDIDVNSPTGDVNAKLKHVRWNDAMDGFLITSLVTQVLTGHKRSDNGFSSLHVSKAVDAIFVGSNVVVSDKNVRARLKTLKKEYAEAHHLLNLSGFGLDPETGRIMADPLAWEELTKGNPEYGRWKTKLCSRYEDMEIIFGNDSATGDRAVTGFDTVSPAPVADESVNELDSPTENAIPSSSNTRKRKSDDGTTKVRHRRAHNMDDNVLALSRIANSSTKIANAMEMQATLDTLNHINWPMVTQKLESMDLDVDDVVKMMEIFQAEEGLARVFHLMTNVRYMRALVFKKLGRNPLPHHHPPPS